MVSIERRSGFASVAAVRECEGPGYWPAEQSETLASKPTKGRKEKRSGLGWSYEEGEGKPLQQPDLQTQKPQKAKGKGELD